MADVDVESSSSFQSEELIKRNKRMKMLAYIVAFVFFLSIVILIFALTVLRIHSPKFRVSSIAFEELSYDSSSNSSSFAARFKAEVAVKNPNFGDFKFEKSTIEYYYGGIKVGEALVPEAKATFKSTKKMNVSVGLSSKNVPDDSNLGSDLQSGFLTLTSYSELSGKVHVMMLMRKKKWAEMSCAIIINLSDKAIQGLDCQ